MKKNIIWLIVVAVVLIGGVYWYKNQNQSKEDDVIKIGVILPLSGEYAMYGENDKKGIELALDELKLDSTKVKIIYLDNKGNAKDAVSAINSILSEKPTVIIDDAISSITEAIIPISKQHKIPIISTGATNPSFSGISPYFFRIWNSDSEEGKYMAQMCINKFNIKYINVVYLDNAYGNGLKEVFASNFKNIKNSIAIPEKTNNYKNIVAKIDNDDPIYFIGYSNEIGLFSKTLREMKKSNKIFSTVATEDKKIFDIAGNSANGITYVYNANVNNEVHNKFKINFKTKYNEDYQILNDVGYDAMKIIGNAIKNHKVTSGNEMVKFLLNMPEYQGASGNIKFDKNGDVHKEMTIKVINNNKFIEIK